MRYLEIIEEIVEAKEMQVQYPEALATNLLNDWIANIGRMDHIGDLEEYEIWKSGTVYIITTATTDHVSKTLDPNPVGIVNCQPTKNRERCIISNMMLLPAFRGKDILRNFVMFLKVVEGFKEIQIDDVQSMATIQAIKKLSQHFDIKWVNNNTGEIVKYDPDTVENFMIMKSMNSHETSPFTIILERLDNRMDESIRYFWNGGMFNNQALYGNLFY